MVNNSSALFHFIEINELNWIIIENGMNVCMEKWLWPNIIIVHTYRHTDPQRPLCVPSERINDCAVARLVADGPHRPPNP
jgi:hypothetical protein